MKKSQVSQADAWFIHQLRRYDEDVATVSAEVDFTPAVFFAGCMVATALIARGHFKSWRKQQANTECVPDPAPTLPDLVLVTRFMPSFYHLLSPSLIRYAHKLAACAMGVSSHTHGALALET
jgi:hypothetical protein